MLNREGAGPDGRPSSFFHLDALRARRVRPEIDVERHSDRKSPGRTISHAGAGGGGYE